LPRQFTIESGNLTVAPTSDGALTFDYFQEIAALSNTNTSNWRLTTASAFDGAAVHLTGDLVSRHRVRE
jgi:hypothetical protein